MDEVTGWRYGNALGIRRLDAAAVLTTPLLPDDYLGQLNPLWSTREPRGRVEAVVAETRDCVTLWLRPGRGWPAHVPGQYVRLGVDVRRRRHDRIDRRQLRHVDVDPDSSASNTVVLSPPAQ